MSVRFPLATQAGFGKYKLIAKLGQGGMAEVFLASHRGPIGFEKLVVIKRLKSGIAEEPDVNAMFLDEARLAARLNHPNVVQTYECGQADEQYFIVMEYLEGQSLDRVSKRIAPSRHRAAYLTIVSDALAGLHHAHDLNDFDGTPLDVVHRDISPHNIFVTYEGQSKVVDFGIAKWATRDANTSTGVVKGKIRYMAPEQALASSVDRRADIFAMGLVFWELVVGERFWGELPDMQVLQRLSFGQLPRLHERWPNVPEPLMRIGLKALSVQPDGRYATAAQMRDDIEAYLGTLGRRPSAAEIGRLLADAFANRRAELKAAISEQLGRLHAQPIVEVDALDVLPVLEERGPWSQSPPLSHGPPHSAAPAMSPRQGSFPDAALDGDVTRVDTHSAHKTIPTILVAPPKAPGRAVGWGAAAVVLLVAGIAVTLALVNNTPQPQGFAGVGPGSLIELQITATPPEATIFLDDAALPQNPFSTKLGRDGAGHRVRVSAEGYAPEARFVVFDQDKKLSFALHPVGQSEPSIVPAPAVSARPSPSAPPVSRPGPASPGRARPKMRLDTDLP